MAWSTTAHVTTGQLKTALERVKTEYEAADEALTLEATSGDAATDDEVAEMLEEVFGTTSDDTTTDDDTTDETNTDSTDE